MLNQKLDQVSPETTGKIVVESPTADIVAVSTSQPSKRPIPRLWPDDKRPASGSLCSDAKVLVVNLMTQCFEALWPRPEDKHQLFALNRETGKGRNIPVKDVNDAAEQAQQLSAAGNDVYVAIASFRDPLSRTAANATGAYVFHMDIDCGEAKAEAGKGYLTPEIAQQALTDFRAKTGLPKPNVVLQSGGGIQVFWTLDNFIKAEAWKRSAWRLKELSRKLDLRADPSRTGDIASVMRIPGTLNWKYDPPRPVVLLSALTEAINTAIMIEAISKAYDQFCPAAPGAAPSGDRIRQIAGIPCQRAILERLRLALTVLDPDVGEPIWKLRRIAPLARLARDCPDLAEAIYDMARAWSRGDYWVHPSRAWITPGHSNGKTGEQVFDEEWQRFLQDRYSGNAVTIATIFHDARELGWLDPTDAFALVTPEEDALAAALQVAERMLEQAKGDPGAPFEPDALAAMRVIQQRSPADFQRLRVALRKANPSVLIREFDAQVKIKPTVPIETHHTYAESLLDGLTVNGWRPIGYGGQLYLVDKNSGLWVAEAPEKLVTQVARNFDGRGNCKRMRDYRDIAEHAVAIATDDTFFDQARMGVACPHGFINIVDGRIVIQPLQPGDRQRVMIPVTPSPLPTPFFDQFLHETFQSSNPNEEEQQVKLIQEFAGGIMVGIAHRYQKAGFFLDPFGRAGKGTLERVIRSLVPSSMVTAVTPFKWNSDYHLAALAGSRLNVVGELPEETPLPAADFKTVIGGDLLMGRHPNFRPFSFKNEAGHLFMSNHLITVKDHSEALAVRWLLFEFPNSRTRLGLPLDVSLADRLISQELPGIAHWALQGAIRLQTQGGYSPSIVHDRLMAKWRRNANSVEAFVFESCELGGEDFLYPRTAFNQAYRDWCDATGRKPFSARRVLELLQHNANFKISVVERNGYETLRGIRPQGNEFAGISPLQ